MDKQHSASEISHRVTTPDTQQVDLDVDSLPNLFERLKGKIRTMLAPFTTDKVDLSKRNFLKHAGVLAVGAGLHLGNPLQPVTRESADHPKTPEKIKPTKNFPVAKEIDDLAKEAGEYFGINHKILLAIMVVEGGGGPSEKDPAGAGLMLNSSNQEEILNNQDSLGDYFIPSWSPMAKRNEFGAEGIGTSDNDWHEFGDAVYLKYPALRNNPRFTHSRENMRAALFTLAMKIKMESKTFKQTEPLKKTPLYDQAKVTKSNELAKTIIAAQQTGDYSAVQNIVAEPIDLAYQIEAIERHFGNSTIHFPRLSGLTYPEFVEAYVQGETSPPLEVLIYCKTQAYKRALEKNPLSRVQLEASLETGLHGHDIKSNWHALAVVLSRLGFQPEFLGSRRMDHYLREHVYQKQEPKILWDSAEKQEMIFNIMVTQGVVRRYPDLLTPHAEYVKPHPSEIMKENQVAIGFTEAESGKNVRICFCDDSKGISVYSYDKKLNKFVLSKDEPSSLGSLYVFEPSVLVSEPPKLDEII